ncbi:MAG: hypothetical protein HY275_07050, partial [Gemmatimonadetes bacterium]|nr:hypothetical protein [Gemmatimonadota bacterium]
PLGPDGMRVGTDLAKVGDSILLRTTWPPAGQARFVAAVRGKRLLLDLARVDLDVRKDTARARAYRTVIPAHSPLPVGTPFTLHGKFGTVTTRITGFDVWTSRVVATLELTPHIDSLAKKDDRMTAVAERDGVVVPASAAASPAAASPAATSPAVKGGAAPPSGATPAAGAATPAPSAAPTPGKGGPAAVAPDTTPCTRDSLGADLKAREKWLKDSLETVVKTTPRPAYTGFTKKAITRATRVQGCFGFGRLAMAVMLRDDRGEWFVERVVIVDDKGKVTPLKVLDLRFRAHELLGAYDVDGDGIDELATRATTERAGAVTILKLDLKGKKLERLAAGFAWEDF